MSRPAADWYVIKPSSEQVLSVTCTLISYCVPVLQTWPRLHKPHEMPLWAARTHLSTSLVSRRRLISVSSQAWDRYSIRTKNSYFTSAAWMFIRWGQWEQPHSFYTGCWASCEREVMSKCRNTLRNNFSWVKESQNPAHRAKNNPFIYFYPSA